MEKAREARQRPERQYSTHANRKKQCRPNETKPHSDATHPHKRQNRLTNGHSQSRIKSTHTRLTYTGSRTHLVSRLVTTQYLHTQSGTTCQRCGRNNKHEAPRERSAHRAIGTAIVYHVESKVSGATRRGGGGDGWLSSCPPTTMDGRVHVCFT